MSNTTAQSSATIEGEATARALEVDDAEAAQAPNQTPHDQEGQEERTLPHRVRTGPRISPMGALGFYISIIVIFAIAHAMFGTLERSDGSKITDAGDAVYFSVVTATTLGYGDILPHAGLGRALAAAEALLEVVVAALFLNSMWLKYTDRIEAERSVAIEAAAKRKEARRLAVYLKYFDTVYERWAVAQRIVTNAVDEQPVSAEPRSAWSFSDLQWIFFSSRSLTRAPSTSAVEAYYDALKAITTELRFVLAQFDIFDSPVLYEAIVHALAASDALDAREALISYAQAITRPGTPGGLSTDAIEVLKQMLRETTEQPDPDVLGPNLLTPVILLNKALQEQTKVFPNIRAGLKSLAQGEADVRRRARRRLQRPSLKRDR